MKFNSLEKYHPE